MDRDKDNKMSAITSFSSTLAKNLRKLGVNDIDASVLSKALARQKFTGINLNPTQLVIRQHWVREIQIALSVCSK